MELTVILSFIYLPIFWVILWKIQIPMVMIQTGDAIDKMHSEMDKNWFLSMVDTFLKGGRIDRNNRG